MPDNILINGTGVSGLLSALLLCTRGHGPNITLLDKNQEPGGLLRKFSYDDAGDFDYGMHNMLETGILELDELLFSLLPDDEWQILDGNKRDLAGIFFRGTLQKHTPYIDIRNLPDDIYKECLVDFIHHLDTKSHSMAQEPLKNVLEFSTDRFGAAVAQNAIIPSIEKIHQRSAGELDYMATTLTPMTRIAICDEHLATQITQSSKMRERVAFVDQRNLPLERSSGRKAYYPKAYGMYRIVQSFLKKLKKFGVTLATESEVTKIEYKNNRIQTVHVMRNRRKQVFDNVDLLVWTSNIPQLGRFLKADFTDLKFDKPLKTIIVNLLIDRPLDIGDLYYFFCYEAQTRTFRVTNYDNYCTGAIRDRKYPVSIELLVDDDTVNAGVDLAKLGVEELRSFGVLDAKTNISFSKAEILASGFPMPTVANIHTLRSIRNQIRDLELNNLQILGILAEENQFFQTDVLIDAYRKLMATNEVS